MGMEGRQYLPSRGGARDLAVTHLKLCEINSVDRLDSCKIKVQSRPGAFAGFEGIRQLTPIYAIEGHPCSPAISDC